MLHNLVLRDNFSRIVQVYLAANKSHVKIWHTRERSLKKKFLHNSSVDKALHADEALRADKALPNKTSKNNTVPLREKWSHGMDEPDTNIYTENIT